MRRWGKRVVAAVLVAAVAVQLAGIVVLTMWLGVGYVGVAVVGLTAVWFVVSVWWHDPSPYTEASRAARAAQRRGVAR